MPLVWQPQKSHLEQSVAASSCEITHAAAQDMVTVVEAVEGNFWPSSLSPQQHGLFLSSLSSLCPPPARILQLGVILRTLIHFSGLSLSVSRPGAVINAGFYLSSPSPTPREGPGRQLSRGDRGRWYPSVQPLITAT